MLEFSNPIPLEGLETSCKDSIRNEKDDRVKSGESICSNESRSSNQPRDNEHLLARKNNESFLIHDSNPWRQNEVHFKWNERHYGCHIIQLFGAISFFIICSLLILVVLRVNISCKKLSICKK